MTITSSAYAVRRITPTEHQLVAARNLSAGEFILHETALVQAPEGRYQYQTFVWDIVDQLLSDKALLAQYNRLRLYAHQAFFLDPLDEIMENAMVVKHKKSRRLVRDLYLSVGTNNIGILDEKRHVRGHGIFPILSRSDHSCDPNTEVTPANWRAGETAMRVKRDIQAGEPLTWTYFRADEFLPVDWHTRNYNLVNIYRFACRCKRCEAERPADMPSSPADLLAHFDKLILADAIEHSNAASPRA